jgi:O-methyltransferase involved in polyketide biosynthesis
VNDLVDPTVPNIARVYDYWLGGKDNFAADRELARKLTGIYPPIAQMVRDNRMFLARAVGWAARQGITQFIDLGAGLPTSPNTYEAARAVQPDARVVYVDNDPLVISHLDALVAQAVRGIMVVRSDLRDPLALLGHPDVTGSVDLRAPVCLVMGTVLHFLTAKAAAELVEKYASAVAPGSYLIMTIGRGDGEIADRFFGMYRSMAKLYNFSPAEFAALFDCLEIVPPGLAEAEQWQPDWEAVPPIPQRPGHMLAGVGRVR